MCVCVQVWSGTESSLSNYYHYYICNQIETTGPLYVCECKLRNNPETETYIVTFASSTQSLYPVATEWDKMIVWHLFVYWWVAFRVWEVFREWTGGTVTCCGDLIDNDFLKSLQAWMPSVHVWSKFMSPISPQFLNQEPPRVQQICMSNLLIVPHAAHLLLLLAADAIVFVSASASIGVVEIMHETHDTDTSQNRHLGYMTSMKDIGFIDTVLTSVHVTKTGPCNTYFSSITNDMTLFLSHRQDPPHGYPRGRSLMVSRCGLVSVVFLMLWCSMAFANTAFFTF